MSQVATALAGERDPVSVWREERIAVRLKMLCEFHRASARRITQPQVAAINERELPAIGTERWLTRTDDRRICRRRQLRAQRHRGCNEGQEQRSAEHIESTWKVSGVFTKATMSWARLIF
jgi:hypothetical protein